ncbi:MAG: N5-carboxyaminoimidazole ribonucleotide mutase, partial [Verrucomicrobiota bacterium]
ILGLGVFGFKKREGVDGAGEQAGKDEEGKEKEEEGPGARVAVVARVRRGEKESAVGEGGGAVGGRKEHGGGREDRLGAGIAQRGTGGGFGLDFGPEAVAQWGDMDEKSPDVGVIMGSVSDWETMKHAVEVLQDFGIAHEARVVSAHRTPEWMGQYAREAAGRGVKVIIAGAGGAAHLPGMVAAQTWLPVLGVPVESRVLRGVDSLLSIVQMPGGIPVGTLAIGSAGARNAALLAASILGLSDAGIRGKLEEFRRKQTEQVQEAQLPVLGV